MKEIEVLKQMITLRFEKYELDDARFFESGADSPSTGELKMDVLSYIDMVFQKKDEGL